MVEPIVRCATLAYPWQRTSHFGSPGHHGCHKPVIPVNQTSFCPSVPHEISVLVELILGHLRYLLTDVPPQPNSPPDNVFRPDRPAEADLGSKKRGDPPPPIHGIIGLESSSTGSSFPADSPKPIPLDVVSLDSRQGQWESR
ncbi:hypothetical protein PIB30_089387 [Stylosanthes scabra]|uniref:Regulator of rDNA transcription protein 15 n=1 Tax=Stylosanthes scabra TaxID=79078 RepID=A0ABU6SUB7_9FABA|nr:hypothetical protein [Stylosanthes scabra]